MYHHYTPFPIKISVHSQAPVPTLFLVLQLPFVMSVTMLLTVMS